MALKYHSATMVQARINSHTPLTTLQIEEIMSQTERYMETIMKLPSTFSFDANKHGIIRKACVAFSALAVSMAEPLSLTTLQQASLQANVFFDEWKSCEKLIENQDYVNYLKSL